MDEITRDQVQEFGARISHLKQQLAQACSFRSLPPEYVWQDYYSPDEVLKLLDERLAVTDDRTEAIAAELCDSFYDTGTYQCLHGIRRRPPPVTAGKHEVP